jgi:prepilin-type N-terminal cleavage/methylation domain-containing protein
MKGGKTPLGYTIIEVLIVLAVSGMMFLIAVNFINGKQGKASFTQGTNEMASQIQNVIEQVTDGQFSDIPLTCSFNGSSTSVSGGTPSQQQGTNPNCVFLGKLFRFYSSHDASTYRIISLAAGRVTEDPLSHTAITPTLQNTHPAVVTDLTNSQNIPQHLSITSVTVTDVDGSSHTDNYNFGFAEGLGAVANDGFQSGAQTISMIYSPVAAPANDGGPGETDTDMNDHLNYAKSAVICLTDGTRFAQILVGGANGDASRLSVNRQVVPSC